MIEARVFTRAVTRGTVVFAIVGGMLTVMSNELATADAAPAVDTISVAAGSTSLPDPTAVCDPANPQAPISQALLCDPSGVATDTAGNLYVADQGHHRILSFARGSSASSTPTVLAPVGTPAASDDTLNEPGGLAVDSAGNIFVANTQNNTIDQIINGHVVRIAGLPGPGANNPVTPGVAKNSTVPSPWGITVDPSDNLYVTTGAQILKITNPASANPTLSVIVNSGGTSGVPVPGLALNSPIAKVTGIAYDPIDGSLILADWSSPVSVLEKITPSASGSLSTGATLSVIAGTSTPGSPTPGPAKNSSLNLPSGVAVDAYGNIFVVERVGARVDKIDTNGTLTVLAGTGTNGLPSNPGPAAPSPLNQPYGIAADAGHQTIYITSFSKSGQVVKVALVPTPSAPAGLVATPGNGTVGLSFSIPADPGYTPVTGYQISVNGGAWTPLATAGSGATLTASLSAVNGVAYSVSVRAVNLQGVGPGSTVSATPNLPPAPIVPAAPAAQAPPAPVAVAPVAVAPVVGPVAPAKAAAPWFKDPLSAVQRRAEIAVPRNPASYRGPLKWTVATDKSRNGTVAIPVLSIRGRQLLARQAATLSGDNLFRGNTATLTGAALVQLRSLVVSLKASKTITCESYTDYAGSSRQLQTLSAQRAAAVCNALRAGGAKVRFTAVGYGMYRPVIVGGTTANRVANRRIVVLVTS